MSDPEGRSSKTSGGHWPLAVVLGACALASMVGGAAWYRHELRQSKAQTVRELQLGSNLKLTQLVQWRNERLGDGEVLQSNPLVADTVARLAGGAVAPADPAAFRAQISGYRAYRHYDFTYVFDSRGQTVLVEPADGPPPAAALVAAAASQDTTAARLLDFYRDEADALAYLALVVPIRQAGTGRLVGSIILRIDPSRFLTPFLEGWPGRSATAESVLLRRDGDAALALTALRFAPDAALRLRIPLAERNRIAAQAMAGRTGLSEGLDYRGKASIGIIQPVPDSPWTLISRVEQAELDTDARQVALLVVLVVGLLVTVEGVAGWMVWRSQRLTTLQRQAALGEALRESEERLRLALGASGQISWDYNTATGRAESAPEYAVALGYPPGTLTESLGAWTDLLHPDDREQAVRALADYLAGFRADYHTEYRLRTTTGDYKWFASVGRIVERSATGQPLRVIGTRADITVRKTLELERQQALEDLQRLASNLQDLLSTSPTVIYKLARVGDRLAAVDVSENIARLLGFTRAEALEPAWWLDHVHPDDRPGALRAMDRLAADDAVAHEYRFRLPDGRTVWIHDQLRVTRRENGQALEVTGAWGDVTERREAENLLRESEQRLRLALKAGRQGLWELEVPSSIRTVSSEYAELLGFTFDEFMAQERQWADWVHPDDLPEARRRLDEYLVTGSGTLRHEFRMLAKGAEWKWVLSVGQVVSRSPDGKPLRLLGTLTDIEERKTAELAATRMAQLYAALSQCNEAIVRSADARDLFGRVCEATVTWGGMDMAWVGIADEATGRVVVAGRYGTGLEYLDGIDISVNPDEIAGRGPTGTCIREDEPFWINDFPSDPRTAAWRERAAQVGWRSSAALPLHRGGKSVGALTLYSRKPGAFDEPARRLLVEMASDVSFALDNFANETERRIKDRALEASINAVAIGDLEGRLTYVNSAFVRLWGYREPADALGRSALEFWETPEQAATVISSLQTDGYWTGEMRGRGVDGAAGPELLVAATLVRDTAGQPLCMLAAFSDVTERNRLERQFLQAQKMEVVGRLAGGIAHDFNNLLTVIIGSAELALEFASADDSVRGDLIEIRNAGQRAAGLTRQLLTFSRQQHVAPVLLQVGERIDGQVKMLRRLLGEDVKLVVRQPPQGLAHSVLIDPGQFDQVLLNLAVNARDAMPNGGTLIVATNDVVADASFVTQHPGLAPGPMVMVSVTDTGVGMSQAVRQRIFEPFFTTKDVGKGTGLGLATVYGVVSQSGGAIEVDSRPGAGTTFRIYLPAVATSAEATPGQMPRAVQGAGTIMLCEDEPAAARVTARMLEAAGYTVLTASNGEQAMAMLAAHPAPVDLLITDVVMPGISGPELATRATKAFPGLRVLFVSGYVDERVHGAAAPDPSRLLPKPFTGAALTLKVRELLDRPQA